jgi:hypothetical protein
MHGRYVCLFDWATDSGDQQPEKAFKSRYSAEDGFGGGLEEVEMFVTSCS